jgi:hypothetical protein
MPSQLHKQLAHRTIVRNRIRHGHDPLEPKQTLCVARHNRTPIRIIPPIRILHVVFTMAVCFPDINLCARYRRARRSFERAHDKERGAGGVGGDGGACGESGRIVGVERAEDGAFGGSRGFGVVNRVHEEGEADNVGEEDEFLRSFVSSPRISSGVRSGLRRTCRTSVHVWPTWVRNCMPAIHSSKLRRVSRAKSWTWETRRSIMYLRRGSEHCELMRCTFSVMFSMVRFFSSGTEALPGPVVEVMMKMVRWSTSSGVS